MNILCCCRRRRRWWVACHDVIALEHVLLFLFFFAVVSSSCVMAYGLKVCRDKKKKVKKKPKRRMKWNAWRAPRTYPTCRGTNGLESSYQTHYSCRAFNGHCFRAHERVHTQSRFCAFQYTYFTHDAELFWHLLAAALAIPWSDLLFLHHATITVCSDHFSCVTFYRLQWTNTRLHQVPALSSFWISFCFFFFFSRSVSLRISPRRSLVCRTVCVHFLRCEL